MSDPILIVIAYTFSQGRTFCHKQNISERKAVLISTDQSCTTGRGRYLTDKDAIVRYGPWAEGRYVSEVVAMLASIKQGSPFDYHAFMYDEVIPWPSHILERYSLR